MGEVSRDMDGCLLYQQLQLQWRPSIIVKEYLALVKKYANDCLRPQLIEDQLPLETKWPWTKIGKSHSKVSK